MSADAVALEADRARLAKEAREEREAEEREQEQVLGGFRETKDLSSAIGTASLADRLARSQNRIDRKAVLDE
jgi:hypothetical protein